MTNEERITHLESLVAHQEADLADLSDMIAKQWRQLDEMNQRFERLKGRVQELEDHMERGPQKEPPPPHY